MDQIADFRGFFDRGGQFEQERYEESVTSFGRVRSKLPSLLEDVRQEEMSFAPRFNIFRALDIERKEDDLHTPMLAHLLDPSAQHSQGNVFLKHFFETIRRHRPDVPEANLLEGGHWTIQREFYIGGGTVDLLIENAGRRYVVVVENKIDTDDHDDQIPRYYKWLMTHRRDYKWQLLIYLTPEGRRPLSCTDYSGLGKLDHDFRSDFG